jgi:hypothetical protein
MESLKLEIKNLETKLFFQRVSVLTLSTRAQVLQISLLMVGLGLLPTIRTLLLAEFLEKPTWMKFLQTTTCQLSIRKRLGPNLSLSLLKAIRSTRLLTDLPQE